MPSLLPNWSGWKTVKVVLGIVGTSAASILAAHFSPGVDQAMTAVGVIDGLLVTLVTTLSGTSMGPALVRPWKAGDK